MTTHELKIWPDYFQAILDGTKTFEVRTSQNRRYQEGDRLRLREYDAISKPNPSYSGRELLREITYVLSGSAFVGIKRGYVVLSLRPLPDDPELLRLARDIEASLASERAYVAMGPDDARRVLQLLRAARPHCAGCAALRHELANERAHVHTLNQCAECGRTIVGGD